jgi:hypothetical protein
VPDRTLYIEFQPELTLVLLVTINAIDDTISILIFARQELSKPLLAAANIYKSKKNVFSWRQLRARELEYFKSIGLATYGNF